MTRSLTLREILLLHERIVATSGGAFGIGDLGALESALAAPKASFSGRVLHQGVVAKAAALGFALIANHPFVDGNKRVGHAAATRRLTYESRRLRDHGSSSLG